MKYNHLANYFFCRGFFCEKKLNFAVAMDDTCFFRKTVADWYAANGRDLPWRRTRDPYLIWVSEIILQQTQVAQGLDYYCRFVAHFPDVRSLAAAPIDEVLKLWQGLGYYSRARNLHASAQQVVGRFGGRFPHCYADVRSLKGVGEYTAAAICSFAFRLPFATVDGNVYRVLARYFGIDCPIDTTAGKKRFAELAQMLLDKAQPDLHNQALMEFGALQCTPVAPRCVSCPLAASCAALAAGCVAELPCKQGKTQVSDRYFNYIFAEFEGKIWLHHRSANDIWRGLYELPLIETSDLCPAESVLALDKFNKIVDSQCFMLAKVTPVRKHVLSHRRIFARCLVLRLAQPAHFDGCIEIAIDRLDEFPISRLMERLLTDVFSDKTDAD